ncbi:unnamed protein product [Orchesella dallaii]|uniref:Odorant receptor n=1 Tax=Orchesella dallaii TaxID=48710 RepID=A0ABP1S0E4_9HEXA
MLKKSKLLSQFVANTNTVRIFTGSAGKINPKKNTFTHNSTPYRLGILISCTFGISHCAHILLNIIPATQGDGTTKASSHKTQVLMDRVAYGVMFTMVNYITLQSSFAMIKNGHLLESFFNGLIQLDEEYFNNTGSERYDLSSYNKWKVGVAKYFLFFLRIMGVRISSFVIGIAAAKHPQGFMNILLYPPGSYLVNVWSILPFPKISSILAKGTIFVLTSWANMVLVNVCFLDVAQVAVGGVALSQMIYMQLRHVNRIPLLKLVTFHRRIQLLTNTFNQIHSTMIVSILMAALSSQIRSALKLVNIIKGNDDSNVGVRLYYVRVLLTSIVIINTVFGYFADVNYFSLELVGQMRRVASISNQRFKRYQVMRKMTNSLQGLKIKFGSDNYVDTLTPFIFQQFAADRVIDALLLG